MGAGGVWCSEQDPVLWPGELGDEEAIPGMGTGKRSKLAMVTVWAEMSKGSYEMDKENYDSGQWVWTFWEGSRLWAPSPITGPDSEVSCWVNEGL